MRELTKKPKKLHRAIPAMLSFSPISCIKNFLSVFPLLNRNLISAYNDVGKDIGKSPPALQKVPLFITTS
jgi:hypothetical protein